ncbi:MAG: NUDIX hydrolase [Chloroflexota bacterium]|nr:NUDIX hydrolase [Chloroflexota bacterium]
MKHPKQIVAVCGLVRNPTDDVLMIKSPKRGWEVPGGQVEEGEDLFAALKREIFEETGITISIGRLVGVYDRVQSPYLLLLCFSCNWVSGTPVTSEESLEVEWVHPGSVLERIDHAASRGRVSDMLTNSDGVVYRVYSAQPYQVYDERRI